MLIATIKIDGIVNHLICHELPWTFVDQPVHLGCASLCKWLEFAPNNLKFIRVSNRVLTDFQKLLPHSGFTYSATLAIWCHSLTDYNYHQFRQSVQHSYVCGIAKGNKIECKKEFLMTVLNYSTLHIMRLLSTQNGTKLELKWVENGWCVWVLDYLLAKCRQLL